MTIDAFCEQCGNPYPWATREERVGKLIELLTLDELSPADELAAREYIQTLAQPVDAISEKDRVRAAKSLKGIAPQAVAASRSFIVDWTTEAVLKAMGLK